MNILLTSFDPFGTDSQNSSLEILNRLPDHLEELQIRKEVLPTQFIEGPRRLLRLLDEQQPDLLLMLGQAGGRKQVTFERVAINCMSARIPDNVGYMPQELPVVPEGPDAYFTNLPLAPLVQHLQKLWLPAGISNSAGTFVCNCLFYQAMHHIHSTGLHCQCDFVHLPYLTEQLGLPEEPPKLSSASCLSVLTQAILYLKRSIQ